MLRVMLVPTAFVTATAALPAQRTSPVLDAKEWTVPWAQSRPRDPSVAADGKIWFVGQVGNYVANLDPITGAFKQYAIDDGTNPHSQIIDKKGMVWYSGNANGMIGRLDPKTGVITRYPMPDKSVTDPHTMVFDKAGNMWFTAQNSNAVGHLNTTTGKITIIKTPAGSKPYGMWMDPKDRPWFCEFGTNKMAMIDASSMTIKEFILPNERTRPRRMAITTDGMIWYDDYTRGFIGRLDPNTGNVEEWPSPSGALALPYGMTVDDKNRLWYMETGPRPNRLIGFDPKSQSFIANQPVGEAAPNTIRYMVYHAPTRSIWYGSDLNMIGRVKIPEQLGITP